MIEKLNEKINVGVQLFNGHAAPEDQAGRIPIGEVVGKMTKRIKNELSAIVACWIYPDYRHLPLDVASIEADVELRGDSREQLYVADVKAVPGIALGNSAIETPGFPGATLLGQLQAFVEKHNRITLFKGDKDMDMTLAELKTAIQEAKFKPTDLFEREVILADPLIAEQVKEKISNAKGYDFRKFELLTEQRAKLEQDLNAAQAKITEHEDANKTLRIESAKSKVGSLFDKQKSERKFDERQTKFIQRNLDKFAPLDPEKLEPEFNTWLDSQVDECKGVAEALGIKFAADGEPEKKRVGAEPGTGGDGGEEKDKYLDPAQNPMIKLG